jgi:cell division septum initiation protein DivIVA
MQLNSSQRASLAEALQRVQQRMIGLQLSGCDKEEVDELVERVQDELRAPQPNLSVTTNFLNSIARSLRTEPAAHAVVGELDSAIRAAGLPAVWESSV